MAATAKQQAEFIERLGTLARDNVNKRIANGRKWTTPSVCIAQSALETGWGSSSLMKNANAFFGIKANKAYIDAGGKYFNSKTGECYNGVYEQISADFRAYDTLEESVEDYFNLLCSWDNYSQAWNTTDYKACINGIQNTAGVKGKYAYATDPKYVSKIINIIEKNNLTRFDNVTMPASTPAAPTAPVTPPTPVITPQAPAAQECTYTVVPGDTLSGIAGRYGTTYQELARINGIANPNIIHAGQVIKLKGDAAVVQPAPQPQQNVYTVVSGDTLCGIARRQLGKESRYVEIKALNGLTSDTIFSGQRLLLP